MATVKPSSLTLIFPGLSGFSAKQWQEAKYQLPALPSLSSLFNCSRCVSHDPSSYEELLAQKFGLSPQQHMPIAALTYWYDKGRPPSKAVLRADPVYLKVDRDSLYLLGHGVLQVSTQEAEALATQINQMYPDTPWALEVGTADRWYISCEDPFNITTCSLTETFGKNIDGYLPQGAGRQKWRAVLNEIQMLLHNSDVNLQRESNGLPPINSVWLWGEGLLPQRHTNSANAIEHVWSNESLCQGLARWAQCASLNLPATFSDWNEQKQIGRHLIVFDDLRIMAKEDFRSWGSKLLELDETWLAPLNEAVKNHRLQLNIETENGLYFECVATLWNKWWPKKRLWHEWFQ